MKCLSKRTKGSTLLETVIAFFIIAGGVAVVTGLYASTFNTQGADNVATTMVSLAESRMGELRAIGAEITDFRNLDGQSGTVEADGYSVETTISTITLDYPCSGLRELSYTDSYKSVAVRVVAPDNRDFELVSLIGAPVTEVDRLEVRAVSAPDPLARDQQAVFEAALIDTAGGAISDTRFRFYVGFGTGNGRIEEQADGRTVHFFNGIPNPFGMNVYTGGTVTVVGRSFYAGTEHRGVSNEIGLAP